ncbi:MAG: hypothetical protein L6R36_005253 [Xanthoria steineri]|nr:MAG: hypothetical protein L6R36_005253 [Xanthoria steineri]
MATAKPFLALTILLTYTVIVIASPLVRNVSIPTRAPECWDPQPYFHPLIFRDCIEIITHEITRGRDPDIPLKFSRFLSEQPDIRLPAVWRSRAGRTPNNCLISVEYASDGFGHDWTTLNDVKRAATAVATQCVIKEPHRGGVVRLGWNNMLGVMIAGYMGPPTRNGNQTGTIESE